MMFPFERNYRGFKKIQHADASEHEHVVKNEAFAVFYGDHGCENAHSESITGSKSNVRTASTRTKTIIAAAHCNLRPRERR